ncbi:MAG: hypothetical protein KBC11_03045 [Candidatus Pacebacteria bacterium]|nr:hypothetical protein [Candidatus Paceibacterota bacterium]
MNLETPEIENLLNLPREWFNKSIVTSVQKINDKFIYNFIEFSWVEMGWDGFFPYKYRGSTNFISDKLFALVLE